MTAPSAVARPGSSRASLPRGAPPAGTLSWRVLRDGPGAGSWNMALDHALAEAARDGVGILRLYGWLRPTVSFGRNEPARTVYGGDGGLPAGADAVRRPTGGRAVLHDDELTYAVVVPAAALGGPRATYRRINAALAEALRGLGADVTVSASGTVSSLDAGPCFRVPAPGEVVAAGRKIVGSAQARLGATLLQHGSILIAGDPSRLTAATVERSGRGDPASPRAGTVTLSELIGPVVPALVAEAVVGALGAALGGAWSDDAVSGEERQRAERLEVERYGTQEWTWRR